VYSVLHGSLFRGHCNLSSLRSFTAILADAFFLCDLDSGLIFLHIFSTCRCVDSHPSHPLSLPHLPITPSSARHSLFLSLTSPITPSFSPSSARHSLFLSLIRTSLPLSLPHPHVTPSFSPPPRQEFKNRARSLEYLSGIITDLFVDWHRLRGVDSRRKIGDLQRAIMASGDDFDGLINAFFTLPNAPSQAHNRWAKNFLWETLYSRLKWFCSAMYQIYSHLILSSVSLFASRH
jgi:hypothetical protein